MEFSWGSGGGLPHPDPALNLLGDHLFADLDDKTLQCLMGGPSLSALEAGAVAAAQESEAGPSCKRPRPAAADDDCFASWLAEGSGGEGEEGDEGDRKGKRLGKKGKPMSQQALAKATREKARRERLNDCFDELARLCDPSGKMVKTDRVSVVVDAIRVLSQLRAENNQLRQLNKFLEERVGTYERQRAQMMYQQAVMQQQQQLALQQQQQQAAVAAAAATAAQQPQQPQQPAALAAAPSEEIQPAVLELAQVAAVPLAAAAAGPSTATAVPSAAAAAAAAAVQAVPAPVAAAPADPASLAVPAAPPAAMAVPAVPAMPAPGGVMPAGMMPAGLAMMPLAPPPGMHPGAAAAPLPGSHQQAALLGVKQEQLAGMAPGSVQPMLLPVGLPSTLPPGAPPMSWLPAASLDVSQDQKLRPPAA